MTDDPNQGDESTSIPPSAPPSEPDPAELDLRGRPAEPGVHPRLAATAVGRAEREREREPEPDREPAESPATLATLAFRLFSSIEHQIARDPNAATITGLAARIDVLERGVASSIHKADGLSGLSERVDEIEIRLEAPDPHAAALVDLDRRLAAVERRLSAQPVHTRELDNLKRQLDEVTTRVAGLEEPVDTGLGAGRRVRLALVILALVAVISAGSIVALVLI